MATPADSIEGSDRLAAVDKLIELGDLEDELDDLWQRRRTDELTAAGFQAAPQDIIQRLEAWPTHLAKP